MSGKDYEAERALELARQQMRELEKAKKANEDDARRVRELTERVKKEEK